MARKYDLISELYNRTCKTVVSNPQNWQAFLASACRNYKLRYDEQLLVYAQRPDATAVLEIEQWNKIFGRWVNRGARGIAVFADENRSRQRLTHMLSRCFQIGRRELNAAISMYTLAMQQMENEWRIFRICLSICLI